MEKKVYYCIARIEYSAGLIGIEDGFDLQPAITQNYKKLGFDLQVFAHTETKIMELPNRFDEGDEYLPIKYNYVDD